MTSFNIDSTITLNNGMNMPVFGLGTWRSNPGEVRDAVKQAIRLGYKHIDCAAVYQNQEEVGHGIAEALSQGLITRDQLFVVSKLWNTEHAPSDVRPACEQTLRELGLEYLDQYLIHWPTAWRKTTDGSLSPRTGDGHYDTVDIDIVETWGAMESLVDAGLVRSIGVSNFSLEEVERILATCRIKPVVNQVECHPYYNQDTLREGLAAHDVKIVAYSPLGNISPGTGMNLTPLEDPEVLRIAQRLGRSPAQVILRWGLQKGNVIIPKSVHAPRIEENSRIFDLELSVENMAALAGLQQQRLVNPEFRSNSEPVFAFDFF